MKVKTLRIMVLIFFISLAVYLAAGIVQAESSSTDLNSRLFLPLILNIKEKEPTIIYFDDFSNPDSGWPVDDDGDIKWSYRDGKYEVLIRKEKWFARTAAPVTGPADVPHSVEAEMKRVEGSKSSYGLLFDVKNWDNYFLFTVDPGDQEYALLKITDGKLKILIPWTSSSSIKSDQKTNLLLAKRDGKKIDVYVNGDHLNTVEESGPGGIVAIGLFLESGTDVPAAVHYDNFAVRSGAVTRQASGWSQFQLPDFPSHNGGPVAEE